jgi:hypothetical protein
VPAGGAVGKPILDDESDSGLLGAVRIEGFGRGEVRHVGVEDPAAVRALVFGIGEVDVDGPSAARVAEVVEGALGRTTTRGLGAAARAAACLVIAAALFDTRRGEVLGARDTLGDIGDIFAWRLAHSCLS